MFCLDVTELIIASIYIHPARSQQMSVPEKPQRPKKAKTPPETAGDLTVYPRTLEG
jgi:hypothetical protein